MAVKKSARYTRFVIPLWGQAVHVVEAPTIAEATMEVRRRWPTLDITTAETERTDGICVQSPADEPIILLPIGAKAGCVAHECLHATTAMLKKVGVPLSVHDDEAAAYTLQTIVDLVVPWLTTRKRPAAVGPVVVAGKPEPAKPVAPVTE